MKAVTRRACILSLFSVLPFSTTRAESATLEIVWVNNVMISGDMKVVTMDNDTGRYVLVCNLKASGCITPAPQGRYYLFTKSTLWQMPGAKQPIDLTFVQDWTVSYPNMENIGLVPVNNGPPDSLGMFMLGSWSRH